MFKTHDTVFERMKLIGEASARTRYAFAATTLACCLIVVSVASAYLSWMHSFALKASVQVELTKVGTTDILKRRLLEEWVASQFITVPILGIRVSVSEVSIFGPQAIMVLMIWYYYSQRRESVAIRQILEDLRMDYESARYELVQIEETADRTVDETVVRPPALTPDTSNAIAAGFGRHMKRLLQLVSNQLVFITMDPVETVAVTWPLWLLRYAFPVITIAFAGVVDFLTFDIVGGWCINGAFRNGHPCVAWGDMDVSEKRVAYLMMTCCLVGIVATLAAAKGLRAHSRATATALSTFRTFCSDLETRGSAPAARPDAAQPPPSLDGTPILVA